MLHIQSLREGFPLFKALGSETRISILELLIEKGPMRMTAIAEELKITGGALTSHVKALNEAGILTIEQRGGRHGIQKVCRVRDERILIESPIKRPGLHVYEAELDVGQFVDCQASTPCGIATTERLLEPKDDPACFSNPERLKAGLLWMKHGFLEYLVPNFIKKGQTLTEIQISLELAPDAPDPQNRQAADVYLWLNNKEVATLTLPKEEGNAYGMFNPAWWTDKHSQRGTFKLITINDTGAYVDGIQISSVQLANLKIGAAKSIPLRLGAARDAANNNGFTLFGHGFGNYPQGIKVRMVYDEQKKG